MGKHAKSNSFSELARDGSVSEFVCVCVCVCVFVCVCVCVGGGGAPAELM